MQPAGSRPSLPSSGRAAALALSLIVALAMAGGVYRVVSQDTAAILTSQLLAAGQQANSDEVDIETQLLELVNTAALTPSVRTALASGATASLFRTLGPLQAVAGAPWLEVVGTNGHAMLALRLAGEQAVPVAPNPSTPGWQPVRQALAGVPDSRGNRFAGLVTSGSATMLIVAAAVPNDQGQLAGVLVAGMPLSSVVRRLQAGTAEQVTIYSDAGKALATTLPSGYLPVISANQLLAPNQVSVRRLTIDDQPFDELIGPYDVRNAPAGRLGVAVAAQAAGDARRQAAIASFAGGALIAAIGVGLGGRRAP